MRKRDSTSPSSSSSYQYSHPKGERRRKKRGKVAEGAGWRRVEGAGDALVGGGSTGFEGRVEKPRSRAGSRTLWPDPTLEYGAEMPLRIDAISK